MMGAQVRGVRIKRENTLMSLVIRWIVTTGAVWVTVLLLQTQMVSEKLPEPKFIILAGLILGLLNALVRPLVIVFTLPLTLLTFGLFIFLINVGMLWLTSELIGGDEFRFKGFGWLLLASLLISLVSAILNRLVTGQSNITITTTTRKK
jgi:putative membrane protein